MPSYIQARTKSIQKPLHMFEKLCLQMEFLIPCHELTTVTGKRMSKDYSFFWRLKTPFHVVSFPFSDEISVTVKWLFKFRAAVWLLRLVCLLPVSWSLAGRAHANLNVCFERLPDADTMSLLGLLIRRAKQITEPEVFRGEKRKIPDQTRLNLP